MVWIAGGRAGRLTLAAVLAAWLGPGCGGPRAPDERSAITLGLRLPDGSELGLVAYSTSGNGIAPRVGHVRVTDPSASISLFLDGIPGGAGYLVELTAVSADESTTCTGRATFDVVPHQTSQAVVALQCRKQGGGGVIIGGGFNACPQLTVVTAAPLAVSLGGQIDLTSAAMDPDVGDTVTFAWTASAGVFADAASPNTVYTCAATGDQTLTIQVSDGQCADAVEIPVTCVGPVCGNGAVEPGEGCEPPGTATCDRLCRRIGP